MPEEPVSPLVIVGLRPANGAFSAMLAPMFQHATPEQRKAMIGGAVTAVQRLEMELERSGYRLPADADGPAN